MEGDGVSDADVGLPPVPGGIDEDVAELDEDAAEEEVPTPEEPVNILVEQT